MGQVSMSNARATIPREHRALLAKQLEPLLKATPCLTNGEQRYLTPQKGLATKYGDQMVDLPNEPKSPDSAFNRPADGRFKEPVETREAVFDELSGQEFDPDGFNNERPLEPLAKNTDAIGAPNDGNWG